MLIVALIFVCFLIRRFSQPTGSGKTIVSELAILRLLSHRPGKKVVYIAPLKALARERLDDWKKKLGAGLGLLVVELSGDVTPDLAILKKYAIAFGEKIIGNFVNFLFFY